MFTPPPTHPQPFSPSFSNARHGLLPYASTLEDVMSATADGGHVWRCGHLIIKCAKSMFSLVMPLFIA